MDDLSIVLSLTSYPPLGYLPGNNASRMMAELMRVDHFRLSNLNTFKHIGFIIKVDGKLWDGRE